MEGQNIVLSGKSLYTQVRVLPTGELLDKNGKEYWRLVYGNMVFTSSDAEFVNDLKDGKIASISLVQGTRSVEQLDGEGNPTGESQDVPTIAYGGHLTYTAAKNIAQSEGELLAIEKQAAQLVAVEAEL